ncbi:integrase catalytic domain-containing protein [Trichonephila clavipes]|nr:integrase catalytic domain-containing protein [Trichonephila clavipes]
MVNILRFFKKDTFSFKVDVIPRDSYTKRSVLSTIARLFDPLGLVGPVVSKAKMFMQKLWRLSIDWKDPLPNKVYSEWHQLLIRLESLNSINIERRIVIENPSSIEIHGFSDASERCYGAAVYCKSKNNSGVTLNPADLISRGVDPDKLLNQELWWNGPEFLSGSDYPNKTVKIIENNDAYNSELKNSVPEKLGKEVPVLNISVNDFVNNLCNISNNYLTILRILSYIFRFVNNARRKVKGNGPLEAEELDKAEIFLIKGVQSQEFSVDIKCLQQQQRVLSKSKLKSLNPFLDSDGVPRVGGRLAVHIEVVSDLTSDAFKATLKRCMSRRGKCAKLFSDNTKNVVGANREIKKLHEMVSKPDDQLARYLAAEGIK